MYVQINGVHSNLPSGCEIIGGKNGKEGHSNSNFQEGFGTVPYATCHCVSKFTAKSYSTL